MDLQVKMPEPRPCLVYGDNKALLYGFAQNAWHQLLADLTPVQHAIPSAIVEFEGGKLGAVPVSKTCSNCGTILAKKKPGDRHSQTANYCPNCVAKAVARWISRA